MTYRTKAWLGALLLLLIGVGPVSAQDTGDPPSQPEGQIGVHWQHLTASRTDPPVLAGNLLIDRWSHVLTAYDLTSGEEQWSYQPGGEVGRPTVHGDLLLLTTSRRLVALNASDGSVHWEMNLAFAGELPLTERVSVGFPPLTPVVENGVIYAALGHWVYAIDLETRAYRWRHETSGSVAREAPVVGPSGVLIRLRSDDGDGIIDVLDPDDGRLLWPMDSGYPGNLQDALVFGDSFIARSADGQLMRLNAANGDIHWEVSCSESNREAMLMVDGQVIATCSNEMISIDPNSGESQWLGWGTQISPIGIMDGVLVLAEPIGDGHMLTAVALESGDQLWYYDFPSPTDEQTFVRTGITVDGRIIVIIQTGEQDVNRLTAIGGTEGEHGRALPFDLNPPAEGDFATLAQPATFRAAPSVEGVVWADLEAGAQVLITGTSEDVDGTTWWKVINPTSGDAGWIDPMAFQPSSDD